MLQLPGRIHSVREVYRGQVSAGIARDVMLIPVMQGHDLRGRWFEDIETREVWRLVAPDFPFRGLWEPVIRGRSNH